uniref:Uncharacterized protein n=1 Tax=Pithovirus LCPAC406 TaxID=2506599 RepID=A0A481ZD65_9VIRU|nr:MAG: uncharacterized protein LCPAC406_00310 [Pithovirus LCPAC406]
MWVKYYKHKDLLFECQRNYRDNYATDKYFLFIWNSKEFTDTQRVGMLSYYVTMCIHFKAVDTRRKEQLYSFLLDKLDDVLIEGKLYTHYFDRILDLISIDKGIKYGTRLYYGNLKSNYLSEMLEEIKIHYNNRRLSIYVYEFIRGIIVERLRAT